MKKTKGIKGLEDLVCEAFEASTMSWSYHILYQLLETKSFQRSELMALMNKDEDTPLMPMGTDGFILGKNGEVEISEDLGKKIKSIEILLKKKYRGAKYEEVLQNLRWPLWTMYLSNDKPSSDSTSNERLELEDKLEQIYKNAKSIKKELPQLKGNKLIVTIKEQDYLLKKDIEAVLSDSGKIAKEMIALMAVIIKLQKSIASIKASQNKKNSNLNIAIMSLRDALGKNWDKRVGFSKEEKEKCPFKDEYLKAELGKSNGKVDSLNYLTYQLMRLLGMNEKFKYSSVNEIPKTDHVRKELSKFKLPSDELYIDYVDERFESKSYKKDFRAKTRQIKKEIVTRCFNRVYIEVVKNQPMNKKKAESLVTKLNQNSDVQTFIRLASPYFH